MRLKRLEERLAKNAAQRPAAPTATERAIRLMDMFLELARRAGAPGERASVIFRARRAFFADGKRDPAQRERAAAEYLEAAKVILWPLLAARPAELRAERAAITGGGKS
jgi:hypothetical protein